MTTFSLLLISADMQRNITLSLGDTDSLHSCWFFCRVKY